MRGALPTQDERQSDVTRRDPRRGTVFLWLVALSLVVAGCSSDDPVGATTAEAASIPLIGAEGDAGAQDAFAVVESAFAAFNAGDMDTWALLRDGSAEGADFGYELAVESRLNVDQCTYRGFQEWTSMDLPEASHGFECAATLTDLILKAAGIELQSNYVWVVAADRRSSSGGNNEDVEFVKTYMRGYRDWLATNHTDVEASIEYSSGDFPAAGSVPTALEHIDEFVAQSDVYPLTEPIPEADYYGEPLS